MIMEGATISSLVYVEIEFNRDVIQMPRRYSCSPGVGILGLLCILQMFKMQEISLHIARKCSGCFFEKAKQTGRSACRQDLCHKIQFHLHEKKTTRLQGGIILPHLGGGWSVVDTQSALHKILVLGRGFSCWAVSGDTLVSRIHKQPIRLFSCWFFHCPPELKTKLEGSSEWRGRDPRNSCAAMFSNVQLCLCTSCVTVWRWIFLVFFLTQQE